MQGIAYFLAAAIVVYGIKYYRCANTVVNSVDFWEGIDDQASSTLTSLESDTEEIERVLFSYS